MKHIIQYSGGICSFFAAKRVVEKYGKENVILLFCDTLIEDKDLYRFIDETTKYLGCELIRVADGRTPFQVYKDVNFLGNSRVAHCSKLLKSRQARIWIKEHYKPEECILYIGIDWTEIHRCEAITNNWKPYKVQFPMCERPYWDKYRMLEELEKIKIKVPRLYKMGFSHNNCGGFCCKAGQGHWVNVLEKMPQKFKYYEEQEQDIIKYIGKDVSMMKKIRNGKAETYTLKQLREDYRKNKSQIDICDIGGCGCFSEYEVDRNTIGQYTGLKDKNGKEIYEGDIFTLGDKRILYIVEWEDTAFRGRQNGNSSTVGLTYWQSDIEILGNVYDNPELLEKGE